MAELDQDLCIMITTKLLTNTDSREVRPNVWTIFPTNYLVDVFADKTRFIALSNLEFETLMVEMNNRVAKSLDCPASHISFSKINVSEPDAFSKGVGMTYTNGEICISYVDIQDRDKLPDFRKNWLGLEYLNTIIHESRHAYQNYKTAQYLLGHPVSSKMAYIAQDNFIEMAFATADLDFESYYDFCMREKDAVGYTYDLISKYSTLSDFHDEIDMFNNHECATMLASNKDGYNMVARQLCSHHRGVDCFAEMFTSEKAQKLIKSFRDVDEECVTYLLQKEFDEYRKSLCQFILGKINHYKKTDNSYSDTLQHYFDENNLYKCYYGILHIEKQQETINKNKIFKDGREL